MLKKLGKTDEKDDRDDQNQKEEKEMSFLDHLEELRWHIIRSVIAIIVLAIVVFNFADLVTDILYAPRYADFFTHTFACKTVGVHCEVPQFKIITRELGEEFLTHLRTSLWLGFILSFPYIFWEVWRFIKPGLYPHERKAARGVVSICSLLFFCGVLFGYFIMAPFAISFLAGYTFGDTNDQTVMLSSYLSYMTMLTLPTGIIFELPVVAFFLGKVGILSSSFMKRFRRHAIVLIFILAAIITPPDLATQLLIGFPLILLYEVSISLVGRIEKKRAKKEAEEDKK